MPTCRNFDVYLTVRNELHHWAIVKNIANLLLWALKILIHAHLYWCYHLVGNFDVQNVEISFNVFFEIFWGHCNLAILGTLGMLDHPHQNHCIHLQETFILIYMQKITFITHFFLKILQKNRRLVILGNLRIACQIWAKNYFPEKWLSQF